MRGLISAAACAVIGCSAFGQTLPDYVDMLRVPAPAQGCIWAGSPPGDVTRLFVLERFGAIYILNIARPAGQLPVYTLLPEPFLSVSTTLGRSVAFSPDFATSGRFYCAYEVPGGSAIFEYRVSAGDPNVADPVPQRMVAKFNGLSGDHAIGSMHFGRDGMLYIGLGDGTNTYVQAQQITSPRGKIVRIDVTSGVDDFPADPDKNFRIPPDNPLVNRPGAAHEVWHIGLRNPWRWSFDRWNGDMWICDVGWQRAGEIDHVPAAGPAYQNFGWAMFDGPEALNVGAVPNPDFTTEQLTWPVHASNHEEGCGTIGGIRYRGNDIRPWRGRFVWTDTCSSTAFSAPFDGTTMGVVQDHNLQLRNVANGNPWRIYALSMVAEDGAGELYVLECDGATANGGLWRIVAAGPQPPLADVGQQGGLYGADGEFDNNDFIVFIDMFFSNDPAADMGAQGGVRGVDQTLDNNDFIVFIDAFFEEN